MQPPASTYRHGAGQRAPRSGFRRETPRLRARRVWRWRCRRRVARAKERVVLRRVRRHTHERLRSGHLHGRGRDRRAQGTVRNSETGHRDGTPACAARHPAPRRRGRGGRDAVLQRGRPSLPLPCRPCRHGDDGAGRHRAQADGPPLRGRLPVGPPRRRAVPRTHRAVGRPIRIFANVTPEFASPLGTRSVGMPARSAVVSSLVDGILIAGPMAGVLSVADGVIVGSALKVDGATWNPVDPGRVRRFLAAASAVRQVSMVHQ